jgi:hypothetical protein
MVLAEVRGRGRCNGNEEKPAGGEAQGDHQLAHGGRQHKGEVPLGGGQRAPHAQPGPWGTPLAASCCLLRPPPRALPHVTLAKGVLWHLRGGNKVQRGVRSGDGNGGGVVGEERLRARVLQGGGGRSRGSRGTSSTTSCCGGLRRCSGGGRARVAATGGRHCCWVCGGPCTGCGRGCRSSCCSGRLRGEVALLNLPLLLRLHWVDHGKAGWGGRGGSQIPNSGGGYPPWCGTACASSPKGSLTSRCACASGAQAAQGPAPATSLHSPPTRKPPLPAQPQGGPRYVSIRLQPHNHARGAQGVKQAGLLRPRV